MNELLDHNCVLVRSVSNTWSFPLDVYVSTYVRTLVHMYVQTHSPHCLPSLPPTFHVPLPLPTGHAAQLHDHNGRATGPALGHCGGTGEARAGGGEEPAHPAVCSQQQVRNIAGSSSWCDTWKDSSQLASLYETLDN